ncbi:hypothetical protein HYQ09_gp165 [Acinetobacter phage vB_AbaM_Konradin]|uniref:Uncharacterized protein n=1 Tax=Acinetobacter phage vB_AbaM_Konradin TaxID=2666257 RepID=A0A650EW55_9CAUD|nr:hypothetical protein HYQ09_gp165 [Acinetobacter phage vB_AbaM_Konradin]QGT53989.1 hypothetical protein Konradin_226 [Acinetobacter phage vB_AbaM_Konradin]
MDFELSKTITVVKIKRKTEAKFFEDVRRGDQIKISHKVGKHPYKSTTPWYIVTNMSTMDQAVINQTSLINGLDLLECL